jgi:hypothetical protein
MTTCEDASKAWTQPKFAWSTASSNSPPKTVTTATTASPDERSTRTGRRRSMPCNAVGATSGPEAAQRRQPVMRLVVGRDVSRAREIGLGLRCAGLGLDQNGASLLVSNDQSTIRFPASDVDGISPPSTSGARARARARARSGAMDSRISAARERRQLRRPGRLTYPNPPAGPGDC